MSFNHLRQLLLTALRLGLLAALGLAPAAPLLAGAPTVGVPSQRPSPALAPTGTIIVSITSDEFAASGGTGCSLREAIETARLNSAFGGCSAGLSTPIDIISLSSLTYTLSIAPGGDNDNNATGDLDLSSPVSITVPLGSGAVIRQTAGDRVLDVVTNTVVNLQRVTLTGGAATGGGGGGLQANVAGARLNLLEVTVLSNTALLGGGVYVNGTGTVLTATRSAVLSNTATLIVGGGGVYLGSQGGELRLSNSTIANNKANSGPGGGLNQDAGTVHLNNVTVVSNTSNWGGGLFLGNGTLNFKNTLVADNAASTGPDCSTFDTPIFLTSQDYNLIESTTDCQITGTTTHNLSGDPLLGPLQLNNGFTLNRLPGTGSPAIDGGNPAGCTNHAGANIFNDQRGRPRTSDGDLSGGAVCDIGAVEVTVSGILLASAGTVFEDDGVQVFSVLRSIGDGPVNVDFNTANGTAVAGSDFITQSGTLSWPANDFDSREITVTVVNDSAPEGDEEFSLELSNATGLGQINDASETAEVYDDEAAGMLQFAVEGAVAWEDGGDVALPVMRANGHTGAVSVNYTIDTLGGQGAGGSGVLNWADGDASARFVHVSVTDDGAAESGETITVTLSNAGGGAGLLDQLTAVVTVLDDDATGTTINVNTTADELNSDGDCSLREAVRAANKDLVVDACPAGSGADTIVLAAQTYTLTLIGNDAEAEVGDLDLSDDVTLVGAGSTQTIISGGHLDRVLDIDPYVDNLLVVVRGLTVRDGQPISGDEGGGMRAKGRVVLEDVALLDNTATGSGSGGGLYAAAHLLVDRLTVQDNEAEGNGGGLFLNTGTVATLRGLNVISNTAEESGGGLMLDGAEVLLQDSTVTRNFAIDGAGGGLSLLNGSTTLLRVTVTGNQTIFFGEGGGLYNIGPLLVSNSQVNGNMAGTFGGGLSTAGGAVVIVGSTVADNRASSLVGVYTKSPTVVADSVVSGNQTLSGSGHGAGVQVNNRVWLWRTTIRDNKATETAGGIYVGSDRLWIGQSLIYSNTALQTGGGLFTLNRVDLVNVTLSGNSAGTLGGGIAVFSDGRARLRQVTLAGNSATTGGGLYNDATVANLILVNTVLADSPTGGNCGGVGQLSGGHNLSTDAACSLSGTADNNAGQALLEPLANNGGPTLTHALPLLSEARDTGDAAVCPAQDQRGFVRAVAAPCDMGAFEFGARGARLWVPVVLR